MFRGASYKERGTISLAKQRGDTNDGRGLHKGDKKRRELAPNLAKLSIPWHMNCRAQRMADGSLHRAETCIEARGVGASLRHIPGSQHPETLGAWSLCPWARVNNNLSPKGSPRFACDTWMAPHAERQSRARKARP